MSVLHVGVWRGGESGRFQEYEVPRLESQTVLDVVSYIQRRLDPTLSYRFACRVGMCGSCAMTVNGKPRWTCRTHVAKVAQGDRLEIAPLANLPVVRDLVTDMTLASTRDMIRLLNLTKEAAPQATVSLVANRLGSNGLTEVEQKDFEASIERKIDFLIPNDPKSVVAATKLGKPLPLAAGSSRLVQSLRGLSEGLNGTGPQKSTEPFWKKFVSIVKK